MWCYILHIESAICVLLHGGELVLQKQALPKLKPKSSSLATKSSRGNQSGSPDRVKSVLELLSCTWQTKKHIKKRCEMKIEGKIHNRMSGAAPNNM